MLCMVMPVVAWRALADDYVDDVYYSEEVEMMQQISAGTAKPQYDSRGMKELVFVSDTTTTLPQDTVRAIEKD